VSSNKQEDLWRGISSIISQSSKRARREKETKNQKGNGGSRKNEGDVRTRKSEHSTDTPRWRASRKKGEGVSQQEIYGTVRIGHNDRLLQLRCVAVVRDERRKRDLLLASENYSNHGVWVVMEDDNGRRG